MAIATLIFIILFLVSTVFTMFIAWRFNERVEDFFRRLTITFAIAIAITSVSEIISYII